MNQEVNRDYKILIDYTNHAGVRQVREIIPGQVRFDSSAWHPEPQWLLDAFDLGKHAVRTFAVEQIHKWTPPGRQASIDISIAKQLQASIERNSRMGERLQKLRTEMLDVSPSDSARLRSKLCGAEDVIRQIINDEEPTWPGC